MSCYCRVSAQRALIALLLAGSIPGADAILQHASRSGEAARRRVGQGLNFYSWEKETALGETLAAEVESSVRLIEDPVVGAYIARLGQNLARNAQANVPLQIKVVDSDEVNAFALPGGFLYVNSGLILEAGNEAELAAAMAHEIGHIAARHGTRQQTRDDIFNIATMPLLFCTGWTGLAVRQAVHAAAPFVFMRSSRAFELEADTLGLLYLSQSGYDPAAIVGFFEKFESLERRAAGKRSILFATHPKTSDRIRKLQNDIKTQLRAQPEYLLNTSQFVEVWERLARRESARKPERPIRIDPVVRHAPRGETNLAER